MEVAPLYYTAKFKDQYDAAGGSTLYGTISSTLLVDCSPGSFPEGGDATNGNNPVCVTKGCDSSMLGEIIDADCRSAFTDDP